MSTSGDQKNTPTTFESFVTTEPIAVLSRYPGGLAFTTTGAI